MPHSSTAALAEGGGEVSNFSVGRQPCQNFEPKRGGMSVRKEHQCPTCDGTRCECANCNNDHHEGGWCSCEIRSLQSQLAAANERAKELQDLNNRWIKIATKHYPPNWAMDPGNPELTISNIVEQLKERAERAEKVVAECEASGFVTKNGEARKVNGTLCLDDDGVIIADGATVYFVDEFGDIVEYDCRGIEGGIPSGLFWSTRDALEVARKQGGRA